MSIYKVGGGSKCHIAPMLSFHPQKLSKSTKNGLRWKLASLSTYMSFEIHPMFHKIFTRSSQSSPISTEKFFELFEQKWRIFTIFWFTYTISTSNESSNHPTFQLDTKNDFFDQKYFEKFDENWIICNFSLKFHKKIFLERMFFEKKSGKSKILWFSMLLNTKNEIYTKISDP